MLAENIKNARKNKGLTQEELAIRLNVVRQTVGKWEKGLSVPDADLLQKMADIFEIEVSALLGTVIEANSESNAVAEQLARLNEYFAARKKTRHRILVSIGIGALVIVLGLMIYFCVHWVIGIFDPPADTDTTDLEVMCADGYMCVDEIEILVNENNDRIQRNLNI